MLDQNEKRVRSKAGMGQDVWPNGISGIGQMWNDPEAQVGMMDDGNYFVADRGDGPVFSQEVQSIIGVESALNVERQVQIQ